MSAQAPTRPAVNADDPAGGPPDTPAERRAPALVTRLVSAGLLIVAAGVLIFAVGHGGGGVATRATVAANTDPALVVTDTQPTLVRVRSVQQVGDAILLRVDPVGSATPRTLIASPGVRVTMTTGLLPLPDLIAAVANPRDAVHNVQFVLEYDALGQVVSLTQRPAA